MIMQRSEPMRGFDGGRQRPDISENMGFNSEEMNFEQPRKPYCDDLSVRQPPNQTERDQHKETDEE